MRDPARIPKVLEAIRAVWLAHPDLRLGQIIDNAATQPEGGRIDVFYIDDETLLARLQPKRN